MKIIDRHKSGTETHPLPLNENPAYHHINQHVKKINPLTTITIDKF